MLFESTLSLLEPHQRVLMHVLIVEILLHTRGHFHWFSRETFIDLDENNEAYAGHWYLWVGKFGALDLAVACTHSTTILVNDDSIWSFVDCQQKTPKYLPEYKMAKSDTMCMCLLSKLHHYQHSFGNVTFINCQIMLWARCATNSVEH